MRENDVTNDNLETIKVFRSIDKFKEFSDEELASFIKEGKLREYEAGEVIIKDAGPADCYVYFLITGALSISKKGHMIDTLRRCGDIFGEMGVIDGSPRSATITAISKAWVLEFDSKVIEQKMESRQINFCYIIYRIFAEVLAVRLRNTTKQSTRILAEVLEDLRKTTEENIMLKEELSQLKKPPRKPPLKPLKPLKPKAKAQEKSLRGKRILIIDSVRSTRKILRSILKDLKCKKIYEAADGESAFTLLENKNIDLILCEWILPKMSGLDLLQRVRNDLTWADLPFIIITSADKEKIESAIKATVSQCVIKPFNANTLFSKIQTALKGS